MFGLFADQQGCSQSHLLNTVANNSSPLLWKVPRLQPMSSVETDTRLPHIWMKEAVAWNPPNLKSTIIFCFPSFFYFSKQHILPSSHQAEHIHLPASSLISLPHGDQSVKGSSVTALPRLWSALTLTKFLPFSTGVCGYAYPGPSQQASKLLWLLPSKADLWVHTSCSYYQGLSLSYF